MPSLLEFEFPTEARNQFCEWLPTLYSNEKYIYKFLATILINSDDGFRLIKTMIISEDNGDFSTNMQHFAKNLYAELALQIRQIYLSTKTVFT